MHFLVRFNVRKTPTLGAFHRRLQKQLYIKKDCTEHLTDVHSSYQMVLLFRKALTYA